MISRQNAHLTNATVPRPSKDFGRTRKAVFTTMGGSRHCETSSSITTTISNLD
jgi:hypothetical protein